MGARDRRRAWYADLRDNDGEIRRRWGANAIRAGVSALAEGCCAWCGGRLEKGWPVDHFLPKEHFPRLSYCWEDLLPSCHTCNTVRKRTYAPPGLTRDSLVDPALDPAPGERVYDPASLLPALDDRLLDPTVDDPAIHLQFQPALHGYLALTQVGTTTAGRMFAERDDAMRWKKLGDHVRWCVNHARSPDDLRVALDELVALVGQRFYVEAYAAFWMAMPVAETSVP